MNLNTLLKQLKFRWNYFLVATLPRYFSFFLFLLVFFNSIFLLCNCFINNNFLAGGLKLVNFFNLVTTYDFLIYSIEIDGVGNNTSMLFLTSDEGVLVDNNITEKQESDSTTSSGTSSSGSGTSSSGSGTSSSGSGTSSSGSGTSSSGSGTSSSGSGTSSSGSNVVLKKQNRINNSSVIQIFQTVIISLVVSVVVSTVVSTVVAATIAPLVVPGGGPNVSWFHIEFGLIFKSKPNRGGSGDSSASSSASSGTSSSASSGASSSGASSSGASSSASSGTSSSASSGASSSAGSGASSSAGSGASSSAGSGASSPTPSLLQPEPASINFPNLTTTTRFDSSSNDLNTVNISCSDDSGDVGVLHFFDLFGSFYNQFYVFFSFERITVSLLVSILVGSFFIYSLKFRFKK
jgi:hypothetical protein